MSIRTFEYQIKTFSTETYGVYTKASLEEILKEEGLEGWELVSLKGWKEEPMSDKLIDCIFKRQL